MTDLEQLSGGHGDWDFLDLASGAQTSKNYQFLYVASDTVFTALNDTMGDVFDDKDLAGKTIPAGSRIQPRRGGVVTDVTVASGSVFAYYN